MRQAPLLMDVTAEFTDGRTDGPTAAPTTRVLPPIITVLPRTTALPRNTAFGLTTVTALPPIMAVPAFTLVLVVGGTRGEARQPRNNSECDEDRRWMRTGRRAACAASHRRLRGGDRLDSQRMRHLCDLFR